MKPEANKPKSLRTPKWVHYKFKQSLSQLNLLVNCFKKPNATIVSKSSSIKELIFEDGFGLIVRKRYF